MMCCDWNTNDKVGGGTDEGGSLPNGGGVLGTAILLIEDRTEVGSEGLRGKMEDASTSQTGCSPLLRCVCTRAQIYGMSHTFVMGCKFKICRTTALRKMLPLSPRLSLRLSEILWLNELADHSSGHKFETAHPPSTVREWSNHRWDLRTRPASGGRGRTQPGITRFQGALRRSFQLKAPANAIFLPVEGSSLIRAAFLPQPCS